MNKTTSRTIPVEAPRQTTTSSKADHPALALTESERIDYLTAVASLVLADEVIDEREMDRLRGLCRALAVSVVGEDAVALSASAGRDHQKVADIKQDNALCIALLTDSLIIVFADGKLERGETENVAALARSLGVPTAQAVLIARHVERVLAFEANQAASAASGALSTDLAAGFTEHADVLPKAGAIRWLYSMIGR